jgi:hypothetical protein
MIQLMNSALDRAWKEAAVAYSEVLPRSLEGFRKTINTLSQESLSVGQDLNPGPPEHKAGVLTIQPRQYFRLCMYGFFNDASG